MLELDLKNYCATDPWTTQKTELANIENNQIKTDLNNETHSVSRLTIWPSSTGIFPLKLFDERLLETQQS